MPDSQLCQPQLIPGLRLETVKAIKMSELCDLVSAPSFHAAAATLYFHAGLRAGAMKWPILLLSTAMLISTPIEGVHYLIDLVIGIAVAWGALGMVQVIVDRLQRRAPSPARREMC